MSRQRSLVVVLLALSLLLIAVTFLFNFVPFAALQAPRVMYVEPANNAIEIAPTALITITFSAPMDRLETENSIRLQPRVAGNFIWRDDQTVTFAPRTRFPISTTLTLNISTNARSRLQQPLQNEFVSRFTTLSRPYVTSSTPALDAQFVYIPNQVTITFNRAMDAKMLGDNVTIEPPPQNLSRELDGNTLTLRGFFEPRTRYQITIPASASDAEYGIELGRAYVWSFTAASQYPNFSILNRGRVLKFPAKDSVETPTQFTNVSRLDAALYAISRAEFDANANALFETWYAFRPASAPIKTWSVTTNAQLDQYTQQKINLGALPVGTYYIKIKTPEGVSDAQLVLVE
ncbi:MAG: hypothetical protein EYC68_03405 [Chloroflexota bacterium]|nr:MAG: hypothetical protein EYC68_03405 [Chloroflexota bacterium]